jgi:hypothetical protein
MRTIWIASPVKPAIHALAKEYKVSKKWLAERIRDENWDAARDAYKKQREEQAKEVRAALEVPTDVVKDNQDKINRVCNLALARVASAIKNAADPDGQVRSKLAIKAVAQATEALKHVTACLKMAGLLGESKDDDGPRGLLDPKALTMITLTLNDPKFLKAASIEVPPIPDPPKDDVMDVDGQSSN